VIGPLACIFVQFPPVPYWFFFLALKVAFPCVSPSVFHLGSLYDHAVYLLLFFEVDVFFSFYVKTAPQGIRLFFLLFTERFFSSFISAVCLFSLPFFFFFFDALFRGDLPVFIYFFLPFSLSLVFFPLKAALFLSIRNGSIPRSSRTRLFSPFFEFLSQHNLGLVFH